MNLHGIMNNMVGMVSCMRFEGNRKSTNVDDRSGSGSSGGGGFPTGGLMKGGIGGIVMLALFFFMSGGNLGPVLNNLDVLAPKGGNVALDTSVSSERKEFVSVVFAHLEDYWQEEFADQGMRYNNPTLVLYSGSVRSACGQASSKMGPFYCPGDQKVYIDLSFMDELKTSYGADGDFAMAYVIAHEVGHHAQYELGISDSMNAKRYQVSQKDFNKYSVQLELQADYFAGMWTKFMETQTYEGLPILEVGDIDEALVAAHAVGDDTLQAKHQGFVIEDSFTHGSSADRKKWFYRGYEYGDFAHGDTFKEAGLPL